MEDVLMKIINFRKLLLCGLVSLSTSHIFSMGFLSRGWEAVKSSYTTCKDKLSSVPKPTITSLNNLSKTEKIEITAVVLGSAVIMGLTVCSYARPMIKKVANYFKKLRNNAKRQKPLALNIFQYFPTKNDQFFNQINDIKKKAKDYILMSIGIGTIAAIPYGIYRIFSRKK